MYFLACSVVMLLAIYQWVQSFIRTPDDGPRSKNLHGVTWLYLIPSCLMSAPVLATLFDEFQLQRGQPLAISAGIISVTLALFGALVVWVAILVDGIRHRRTQRGFVFFSGRRLALATSVSLVLVSATSHLIFARDAGTVIFEFFRDEVKDMHCDSGLVLFQWDRSPDSPVRYRCPTGYILNRHSSLPFMPWPDYHEGYSADLAAALHEIMKDLPER